MADSIWPQSLSSFSSAARSNGASLRNAARVESTRITRDDDNQCHERTGSRSNIGRAVLGADMALARLTRSQAVLQQVSVHRLLARNERRLWGPHFAFVDDTLSVVKIQIQDVSADHGCEG